MGWEQAADNDMPGIAPQDSAPRGDAPQAPLHGQRLRQRDPAAWEALYDACGERVSRAAHKILPPRLDPEGAAQQTWVRAIHRARRLDLSRDPVPWILSICTNLCISVIRRDRIKQRVFHRKQTEDEQAAQKSEWGRHGEEASRVRKGVSGLPRTLQEIVYLRYACGMPTEEVAEVLGLKQDAVRKRLSRAYSDLRTRLESEDAKASSEPAARKGDR